MCLLKSKIKIYYDKIDLSLRHKKFIDLILNDIEFFDNFDFDYIIEMVNKLDYRIFYNIICSDIDYNFRFHIFDNILNFNDYYFLSDHQIKTKRALQICNNYNLGNVISVGSWYGQHGWFLYNYSKITYNEIDVDCIDFLKKCFVDVIDGDMMKIDYFGYDTVINTSCEHIDYKKWISLIKSGTMVVLQSTNMDHSEHMNIHRSLSDFIDESNLKEILYKNEYDIVDCKHKRFFIVGIK